MGLQEPEAREIFVTVLVLVNMVGQIGGCVMMLAPGKNRSHPFHTFVYHSDPTRVSGSILIVLVTVGNGTRHSALILVALLAVHRRMDQEPLRDFLNHGFF